MPPMARRAISKCQFAYEATIAHLRGAKVTRRRHFDTSIMAIGPTARWAASGGGYFNVIREPVRVLFTNPEVATSHIATLNALNADVTSGVVIEVPSDVT